MNFLTAMQTPIVFGPLRFMRLDMDDLAALIAEHVEPKINLRKQAILSDPEMRRNHAARFEALGNLDVERDKIDMVYLLSRADNPQWIGKFLCRALIKGGGCQTNEEAAALIKANLHFSEQRGLAIEVLSPPRLEDSPPLPEAVAQNATAGITDSTSPSSDGSVESNPAD